LDQTQVLALQQEKWMKPAIKLLLGSYGGVFCDVVAGEELSDQVSRLHISKFNVHVSMPNPFMTTMCE